MNKEEKSLLLKDLCARLPYNVIVRHADSLVDNCGNDTGEFWYKMGYLCDIATLDDVTTTIIESEGSDEEGYEHICVLENTVPYLRPMSSMTEEEYLELEVLAYGCDCVLYYYAWFPVKCNAKFKTYNLKVIDWLNAHHFDYRGLIEKGLAIEAPEGMYN